MKAIVFVLVAAATLAAQEQDQGAGLGRGITAAGQFFDHDFVNLYVFGDGIWDSRVPILTSGQTSYTNGFGWDAGGGLTASHLFKGGDFAINYRGDYRDYRTALFSGGTDQTLSMEFHKRLNRRWTFGTSVAGGILSYGSGFYTASSATTASVANPFSSHSRFLDAGISLTYNQTRRLSYVFSGSYFLSNYSSSTAFNSFGGGGGVSVLYRTTAKTTLGVNYSHTYYTYSGGAGQSEIDGLSATFSHRFPEHWQLDLSGGANRSHSHGTILESISTIFNGQLVTGYFNGPYNSTAISPSYQLTLTRFFRHSSFSLGGGQSILPGNGIYLTSRSQSANATYSYSTRRSNLSFGGAYIRLVSVANSVNQDYATATASASYGINLVRYVSANFRYDFIHYDGLFAVYGGLNEHRLSFGLNLSTKSVPLTLF